MKKIVACILLLGLLIGGRFVNACLLKAVFGCCLCCNQSQRRARYGIQTIRIHPKPAGFKPVVVHQRLIDQPGNTYMHMCVLGGNIRLLKSIVVAILRNDKRYVDTVSKALFEHDEEFLKKLDSEIDGSTESTMDKEIAQACRQEYVREWLYRLINTPNALGNTPLHFAALQKLRLEKLFGHKLDTDSPLLENILSMVDFLLKHRAEPNIQNKKGETPLHLAVSFSFFDLTVRLLHYHTNVNFQDCNGNTPMHIACSKMHLKTIEGIAQNGYNRRLRNKAGFTARQVADQYDVKRRLHRARSFDWL